MCIAVIKPKGAAFPSKEILNRCFTSNDDGAGIAWQDGDTIRWVKGLMSFDAFWAKLLSLNLNTDSLVFMHFRIGTHGGKTNPNMTHPFPILTDKNELLKLEGTCRHIAMHNGIIGKYGTYTVTDPRYEFSDTVNFTAEWVAPQATSDTFFLDPAFETECNKESSHAKYAIMGGGHYKTFGTGWILDGGCYYSNSGFRPFVSNSYGRGTTGGSYGGGCGTYYGRSARKNSGEMWTRNVRVLENDEAFIGGGDGSKKTPLVYLGVDFNEVLLVNEFDEVYQNQPNRKHKVRWIKVGTLLTDWQLDSQIEMMGCERHA